MAQTTRLVAIRQRRPSARNQRALLLLLKIVKVQWSALPYGEQRAESNVRTNGRQEALTHKAGGHRVAANVQRNQVAVVWQRIAQRPKTCLAQGATFHAKVCQRRRVGGGQRSKRGASGVVVKA